jgi:hypothetical protein
MNALLRRFLAGLAAFTLLAVASGCRSVDDDASSRPWNSPKGWENGIPSTMTEGR